MKRILLILAIFFSTLALNAQTVINFPTTQGYSWQQVGNTCAGCTSFFVGVTRSNYPNEVGSYKYSVYYQSNSFGPNGASRLTYISGIRYFYWNGYWTSPDNSGEYWNLIEGVPTLAYSYHSQNPQLLIKIIIGNYVYR